MDHGELVRWIQAEFHGVTTATNQVDTAALPDWFFTYDPDGDLDPQQWHPFATIVTGDHYDTASALSGSAGGFRLNVGLTKATYLALLGPRPTVRRADGIFDTGHDYTHTNTVLPHPFYASQNWVCLVNPAPVNPEPYRLLREAYEFAVRKHRNRAQARG
jgi:hypothetical protein